VQSIWADITLTVGEYLFKRMMPDAGKPYMDVRNMEVFEAQVLNADASNAPAQFIRIEGVMNMGQRQTQVSLYAATADGARKSDKAFATAVVCYEDVQTWRTEWQMTSHLVAARAASLWKAAACADDSDNCRLSRLSRGAVYQLFANVVDYGTQYRGMHRVALDEDNQEATADVVLDTDCHGTWHTPPHWIDSTFQLAGFVMNAFGVQGEGETAGSSRDFFYITPGWRHLRIAEPLEPGPHVTYRNYVHMFPVEGEPGTFAGDIYLLRSEKVVGVCAGIRFKRVPRAFMPIMFPQTQGKKPPVKQNSSKRDTGVVKAPDSVVAANPQRQDQIEVLQLKEAVAPPPAATQQVQAEVGGHENPRALACLQLIADETGLDLEDLSGEAAFADLGVDSLMSLALSGKIRAELGIDVQASIFLECPTVEDLLGWLSK
jgi:asperthecin polyketide synthase